MSNIEGERMMGQGGGGADVGVVRGPKGQAADLLSEIDALQMHIASYVNEVKPNEELPAEAADRVRALFVSLQQKRDLALRFLLDQFSK
jgi:hypothetical protein